MKFLSVQLRIFSYQSGLTLNALGAQEVPLVDK